MKAATGPSLSIRADNGAAYGEHRGAYLAQLVAPLDDMWATFADQASAHALHVGDELAGSCAVDGDGQLLRFFVLPGFSQHSEALLRLCLSELPIQQMIVSTLDPAGLCPGLDVAQRVESHSLLFAAELEPAGPGLPDLTVAQLDDHARIVEFQLAAVGMPREFLEPYTQGRLERQELLLFEEGQRLLCVGELRADQQQPGIAHVGLIVHEELRGQGIGTKMLCSLVKRCGEQGLAAHCSTEVTNLGARRAIERAGFRAHHRVLRLEFSS